MNTKIKTTNIVLTAEISSYVEKRLSTVEKLLESDPSTQCNVELARTTSHHLHGDIFRAEIHIIAKDRDIYVESEKSDLYTAIDVVRDEVIRKIKSVKEKRQSLIRRGGAQIKNIIKGFWPKNR